MRCGLTRKALFFVPLLAFSLAILALVATLPVSRLAVFSLIYGLPDDEGIGKLVEFVQQNFRFPKRSVISPEQWPAFGVPGTRSLLETHQQLYVYYITRSEDQDELVALVSDYLRTHPHLTTDICFFEGENWITWSNPQNGARGGERGPEKLLRRVILH